MQRAIVKYGLALHLALLAAAPCLLRYFSGGTVAAGIVFWVILFALEWLVLEPSVRSGETFEDARGRVFLGMLKDPFLWVSVVLLVYFGIGAMNTANDAIWIPEEHAYRDPGSDLSALPSSVSGQGKVLFATVLSIVTLGLGLRHALGKGARGFCVVAASFFTGLGGLIAVSLACCGWIEIKPLMNGTLLLPELVGDVSGVWFVISVTSLGMVEDLDWKKAGYPAAFVGITGNLIALLFFTPAPVTVLFLAAAVVPLVMTLLALATGEGFGSTLRGLVAVVLAVGAAFFIYSSGADAEFQGRKAEEFKLEQVFTERYTESREVLMRCAERVWERDPRLGCGFGAFVYNVNYAADKEDLDQVPLDHRCVPNGYLQLAAEFGAVGVGLIVIAALILLLGAVLRGVSAYSSLLHDSDAPSVLAGFPPIVWAAPMLIAAVAVEAWWTASPANEFGMWVTLAFVVSMTSACFVRRVRATEAVEQPTDDKTTSGDK